MKNEDTLLREALNNYLNQSEGLNMIELKIDNDCIYGDYYINLDIETYEDMEYFINQLNDLIFELEDYDIIIIDDEVTTLKDSQYILNNLLLEVLKGWI